MVLPRGTSCRYFVILSSLIDSRLKWGVVLGRGDARKDRFLIRAKAGGSSESALKLGTLSVIG
jgi:hypothetical protein